jgi:magnesium chelatase family protein
MFCATQSFVLDGLEARRVRVEVAVHKGLPAFQITGTPDAAVRESRERIRAAIVNSGFDFPLRRITVNLSPSSARSAPGLDLAIALALLGASGQVDPLLVCAPPFVGELALDGSVRAVPGAVAFAKAVAKNSLHEIVVPAGNGGEAALVKGVEALTLDHLRSIVRLAGGGRPDHRAKPLALQAEPSEHAPDLCDLRSQAPLRRALTVAAAGNHSLLLEGARGSGRSFAAARLPSILPPLSEDEALEVALISSCTGRPISGRPFRAPHHTISPPGLAGANLPGEVTLAHRGVLYLDSLAEFRRDSLGALEAVLDGGRVFVGGKPRVFPAHVLLVASVDPCPCGLARCQCAPAAVHRYRVRLERTIASLFEIRCAVKAPSAADLSSPPGEPSAEVRERVSAARELQSERLGKGVCNADMGDQAILEREYDAEAADLLNSTVRPHFRGVAFDRVMRVAQTLADLDGSEEIGRSHVEEAAGLVSPERR